MKALKNTIFYLLIGLLFVICSGCPGFVDNVVSIIDNRSWSFYQHPTFSPDGSKIAYIWRPSKGLEIDYPVRGRDGLWIMDANGENRTLVKSGKYLQYPAFSPDGSSIIFSRQWLYKIDTNGENLETIYNEGLVRQTSWSPSGDRLVFASDSGETFHNLFLLRIMNTNDLSNKHFDWFSEKPIGSSTRAFAPVWHPDGDRIIFYHKLVGICTVDTNGSNYDIIQNFGKGFSAGTISISPDGKTLAHDVNDQIWVVGIDGNNPRRLTNEGKGIDPCWSPDGKKIVYIAPDPEEERVRVVWIMDANGTNRRPLTRATDEED